MTRASFPGRFGLALLSVLALGAASRTAHAEPPTAKAVPVYVLSLWTDDADDQADALTQALRSRVRQAQGWSLLETPQSFETLAIALKCPPKPDAPCLQRVADQLHADHYVWGTMNRKKGPGEVTADVHLWSRGKPEAEASESYSDNLKDASDEALRQIAARLFGKVTGAAAAGTLVVHAGTGGGVVLVDGVEKATLEGGVARVDVPAGDHTILVRVPGFEAPPQQAAVPLGQEQETTFNLTPAAVVTPESPHAPFPTRRVVAYSAVVAGAGLLIAGGIEGLAWLNDKNTSADDRNKVPSTDGDVCANEVNSAAIDACQRSKNALVVSRLGWIFAGAGAALLGTGIVLLTTGHDASEMPHDTVGAAPKPKLDLHVLPAPGARGGWVDMRLTF